MYIYYMQAWEWDWNWDWENCERYLGVDQAVNACNLILERQGNDVVLKRIGDPSVFDPDVGDTFMRGPVLFASADCRIDELVKVVEVWKDDMTADVEEEILFRDICTG